jgi:hypothetical protein
MTGEDAERMWPDMDIRGGPMSGAWICPRDLAARASAEDLAHVGEQAALGFRPFELCVRGRAVYAQHIRAVFWEDVREKTRAYAHSRARLEKTQKKREAKEPALRTPDNLTGEVPAEFAKTALTLMVQYSGENEGA